MRASVSLEGQVSDTPKHQLTLATGGLLASHLAMHVRSVTKL